MVFSSVEFLLGFLPAFLLLYWITPAKAKNVVLLTGSLIFYGYGEPHYLILLMVSILVNYFFGLHIGRGGRVQRDRRESGCGNEIDDLEEEEKTPEKRKNRFGRRRRLLFGTAVSANLLMLFYFKLGFDGGTLPVGISFYTFQILSYLIDVYRRDEERENSFIRLATYITMFPQLLSGPIVTYGEVRQDLKKRSFTAAQVQEGIKVFILGLSLKVLLADRLNFLWQEVQVTGFESISTPLAWIAAVAYSLKIYFDFYGYSLMAVGLGKMFGFSLPENFKNPYMACSVREFYRRWHMTLGRWFCKYVYIPLGGSRCGEGRTICNLFVVWILTSLWHGLTGNFLIWGMLLCLLIILERLLQKTVFGKIFSKKGLHWISHFYLWAVIPVTWVCFAVTDIGELQLYLERMFGLSEGIRVSKNDWLKALQSYGYLFAVGLPACTPALKKIFNWGKDKFLGMLVLVALLWLCIWRLQVEGQNPFMYFQF